MPRKPCKGRFGNCPNSVGRNEKYCPSCAPKEIARDNVKKREAYREYNKTKRNPVVTKWMGSNRYKDARRQFLAENPLCVMCLEGTDYIPGRPEPAVILDHKTPHKGDPVLFWDQSNWQGLCDLCHRRKSASKDGSLGNPIR